MKKAKDGDTFRLGGKEYAKIYLVGKTLKVYFALSPEDYKDSTYPIEDQKPCLRSSQQRA